MSEQNLVPNARLQSVTHGATSDRILSTVANEIAEILIRDCPWVLDLDLVAIEQYCRVEARVRLLSDWMNEIIEEKGPQKVPPYLWGEIRRAENNAFRRADSLGLSPEGRMKIAKDAILVHGWQAIARRVAIIEPTHDIQAGIGQAFNGPANFQPHQVGRDDGDLGAISPAIAKQPEHQAK